jgi:hypothetical protein
LSCGGSPGWGVLLWAAEDAGIPSGTPLKVYIKSNIEKVWVVGVPAEYRKEGVSEKIEVPLSKLELVGSRWAARKRAAEFARYATSYAETLQDGLPVRDAPDNNARRVYRLRSGEFVKILEPVGGVPAISASGAPLPGEGFRVLTEGGTRGYCFSYRLRLFEHTSGALNSAEARKEAERDAELEGVLSKTWVAEVYGTMLTEGNIDIDAFSKRWGFFPGEDTGIARVSLPDTDASFQYTSIRSEGGQAWVFEGADLSMTLRSPATLEVRFSSADEGTGGAGLGVRKLFVNLPAPLADIIVQEETRRQALFAAIYAEGRAFASANYGRIALDRAQNFVWQDYGRLASSVVPAGAEGRGRIEMRLFLGGELDALFDGALTFYFAGAGGEQPVNFLYKIDERDGAGGLRLEFIPDTNLDGNRVVRRDAFPLIIYFYESL